MRLVKPHLSRKTLALGCAALALVLLTAWRIIGGTSSDALSEDAPIVREVVVASVAELGADGSPLSVIGEVTSRSEASLRAESGGRVVSLSYRLGDNVPAGAVIAEFENALQRASVTQARGVLAAAEASFEKISNGSRDEARAITGTNLDRARSSLASGRSSAADSLRAAYATNDELVNTKLDSIFSETVKGRYSFLFITGDASLVSRIETERASLDAVVAGAMSRGATLSKDSDLSGEIKRALEETRRIQAFVDALAAALSATIADTADPAALASASASVSAARGVVAQSLATLSGLDQNLISLASAYDVAIEQSKEEAAGARPEDLAAARASLTQAEGAYAAALAGLDKTIIRSPISGTINSLSIERGDYVSPMQEVAVVSNNGALEIVAKVTADDRRTIAVGNPVSVEGTLTGVVTRIAPALDPTTKSIEVRIGLSESGRGLVTGQSVRVGIARTASDGAAPARTLIPISAVKMEPDRTIVFTAPEGVLVAHEVELGVLFGDRVEIRSGITPEMHIVTDARGLKEGQSVSIADRSGTR